MAAASSPAKRKLFRWAAVLLVPAVFLLLCEVALRLAGSGYPTRFFIPSESSTGEVYRENLKFGWRFFPARLARAPEPIRISKTKPPGTIRVFVFGESAALGDPEPAYGFSRILRELLEARCPGTRFEVVNVAMTAISSPVILRIAQDCAPFQGDIWIIYMGNNEVIGPFAPGSVFGLKAPPRWLVWASLAAKRTRLGQFVDSLWQRTPASRAGPQQWEGMKMMLHEQFRASDPVLQRTYRQFGLNLRGILSLAARAGAKPIVCSVSSNLRDCPPFASLHKAGFRPEQLGHWSELFAAGTNAEARNDFSLGLALYQQAAELDDSYAELAFRMGRCQAALGQVQAAREQFQRARDLDTLRFRADSSINRIIREVCAAPSGEPTRWVDSEAVLTNGCAFGIPGAEYFWDHVHLNFAGNYRLAVRLASEVVSVLPDRLGSSPQSHPKLLTEAECAALLACTDFDQRQVFERMWRRFREPPFTDQADHASFIADWSARRVLLAARSAPDQAAEAISEYRQAVEHRPDDWLLHYRFGLVLESSGKLPEAQAEWRGVVQILPEYADAWFKLGDVYARQSKPTEAALAYQQVLQLRPNSFEAMNGLGLVRMSQDRFPEAAQWFEHALRIDPSFAQAHVNLGLLLERTGSTARAEEHFRQALASDPESVGAHINLANLLAAHQDHSQAIEHYDKALELEPQMATVHFSLANSLEATGHSSEALAHYRQAIRLDPGLAEAHFNLGLALAKQGDLESATASFEKVVQLSPQDAQAHLNLGVALAKQRRLQEAVAQFEAVLRLDPGNAAARQYLATAFHVNPSLQSPRSP